MVPADSHRVSRAPRYSGSHYARARFGYGAVILCGATFQTLPLAVAVQVRGPTTPRGPEVLARFGLFPVRSPLLGESLLFSLPAGTKMFQFPALASSNNQGCMYFIHTGCPIRKSRDQGLFAPTPGLSQLITSFIASVSQGIHLAPFSTSSCTMDSDTVTDR